MKREIQSYVTMMGLVPAILICLLCGGCSTAERSTSDLPPATQAALRHLYPGMPEIQARQVMKPVSLNWGRMAYGKRGVELFFQVSPNKQVRLVLEPQGVDTRFWTTDTSTLFQRIRFKRVFVVSDIGKPEPKDAWKLDDQHNFIK